MLDLSLTVCEVPSRGTTLWASEVQYWTAVRGRRYSDIWISFWKWKSCQSCSSVRIWKSLWFNIDPLNQPTNKEIKLWFISQITNQRNYSTCILIFFKSRKGYIYWSLFLGIYSEMGAHLNLSMFQELHWLWVVAEVWPLHKQTHTVVLLPGIQH